MLNKILLTLIGLIILTTVAGGYLFLNTTQPTKTPTETYIDLPTPSPISDYTASFVIFTNGTLRTFSDPKYHNLSPDVYIQKDNPNIIFVKKPNLTWGDFFKTLPMKVEPTCLTTGTGQMFCNQGKNSLEFYINGEKVDNFLTQIIKPNDQALITYGTEDEKQKIDQLNKLKAVSGSI